MVRSAEEHLRRQVPALLFAQRADDNDRLKWELLHTGGDIPATALAGDDELLALLHYESLEKSSIGEVMVKAYTRERGELAEGVERRAMAPPYLIYY
jgi:hypothetical protein